MLKVERVSIGGVWTHFEYLLAEFVNGLYMEYQKKVMSKIIPDSKILYFRFYFFSQFVMSQISTCHTVEINRILFVGLI